MNERQLIKEIIWKSLGKVDQPNQNWEFVTDSFNCAGPWEPPPASHV